MSTQTETCGTDWTPKVKIPVTPGAQPSAWGTFAFFATLACTFGMIVRLSNAAIANAMYLDVRNVVGPKEAKSTETDFGKSMANNLMT